MIGSIRPIPDWAKIEEGQFNTADEPDTQRAAMQRSLPRELSKKAAAWIGRNPTLSMGIALAVGGGLGWLIKRK